MAAPPAHYLRYVVDRKTPLACIYLLLYQCFVFCQRSWQGVPKIETERSYDAVIEKCGSLIDGLFIIIYVRVSLIIFVECQILSEAKRSSGLFVVLCITISIFIGCVVCSKRETVFPAQSQAGFVKNELISAKLSEYIKYRSTIRNDVMAISAVSSDGWIMNGYEIEFTLTNGKKIIGKSRISADDARGIPKSFRADRLTDDYLEFLVLTDGAEYARAPSEVFFSDFYYIVKSAYVSAVSDNRDLIKEQWQDGIDEVNVQRARIAAQAKVQ